MGEEKIRVTNAEGSSCSALAHLQRHVEAGLRPRRRAAARAADDDRDELAAESALNNGWRGHNPRRRWCLGQARSRSLASRRLGHRAALCGLPYGSPRCRKSLHSSHLVVVNAVDDRTEQLLCVLLSRAPKPRDTLDDRRQQSRRRHALARDQKGPEGITKCSEEHALARPRDSAREIAVHRAQ